MKTSMELCECNRLAGQRRESLDLCNTAYFIGQVDNFSKSAPALLLNVCYQACKLLAEESMDCCSQDELWLQRLDHVAMSTLDFTYEGSRLLHKAYVRLFLRPLLNKKVTQTVAWAALKRLLQLRKKMGGRIRTGLKLDDIVAPLLFVTGSVAKASDLDLKVIRALCQKLAVLVEEREVRTDHIASNIYSYGCFCSSDKDNKLSYLFAVASVFFQNLADCNPSRALVDDPFTKKGVQSRMSAGAPDPLATREVIRILSEELRECGKEYMADSLSSAFQFWLQPAKQRVKDRLIMMSLSFFLILVFLCQGPRSPSQWIGAKWRLSRAHAADQLSWHPILWKLRNKNLSHCSVEQSPHQNSNMFNPPVILLYSLSGHFCVDRFLIWSALTACAQSKVGICI